MKRFAQNRHFYILIILLGVVLTSCVKEMDFDGIKDVQLTPTMNIDLMEAEITTAEVVAMMEKIAEDNGAGPPPYPPQFYEGGLPSFTTSAPVDIASEERITKYLENATLYFEFKNTTPRDISIDVRLKDGNNILSGGTLNKILPASNDTPIIDSLVFTGSGVEDLKKLNNVEIEIDVASGTALSEDSPGEFSLSSTGTFNFEYDVSNGLP